MRPGRSPSPCRRDGRRSGTRVGRPVGLAADAGRPACWPAAVGDGDTAARHAAHGRSSHRRQVLPLPTGTACRAGGGRRRRRPRPAGRTGRGGTLGARRGRSGRASRGSGPGRLIAGTSRRPGGPDRSRVGSDQGETDRDQDQDSQPGDDRWPREGNPSRGGYDQAARRGHLPECDRRAGPPPVRRLGFLTSRNATSAPALAGGRSSTLCDRSACQRQQISYHDNMMNRECSENAPGVKTTWCYDPRQLVMTSARRAGEWREGERDG